jgi:hypothetical protein
MILLLLLRRHRRLLLQIASRLPKLHRLVLVRTQLKSVRQLPLLLLLHLSLLDSLRRLDSM